MTVKPRLRRHGKKQRVTRTSRSFLRSLVPAGSTRRVERSIRFCGGGGAVPCAPTYPDRLLTE
nr:ribosomal protein S16 [Dryopteris crassirhizoma]